MLWTQSLKLVSLCFWMLDVANSFRTGYITSEGVLEMRISKVTRRYIKTWMALDLSWVMCDWVVLFRRWLFDPGKDTDALANKDEESMQLFDTPLKKTSGVHRDRCQTYSQGRSNDTIAVIENRVVKLQECD